MKTKRLFRQCVLLFLFLTAYSYSQEKGTIRGIVKDSTTLESLPFGNVYIKELNLGVPTNNRGYFVMRSIPANKNYTVVVSYVGYKIKTIPVFVETDKVSDIEALLIPSNIQMKDIEKVEYLTKEANLPDLSKSVLTLKEIEMIPKSVETDILRSLTSLPGVQSNGDVSVKFNVRGGETNQNLILLDGMAVYYPFHAIGLFGIIEPDVISSVEFFRGGFSSKYGRAVSSILNLVTREGNKNKFNVKLGASLLSGKVVVEGPIPDGSFYITSRKSFSNKILEKFVNNNNLPIDFYDTSFKINFANPHFFSGSEFTLQSLMSGDNLKYTDVTRPDYKWKNNNWGLKIFSVGDIPLFLDFGITLSQFSNEIISKESGVKPKMNEVSDFTVSADFLYVLGNKDEISFGADIKSISTKLWLNSNLDFRTDVGNDGLSSNAYVNYKFLNIPNLGIDFGTRLNLKDISAKGIFAEPRVSISYILTPRLTLKTAYGIYQQDVTTIVDEREVLSLFDPVIIIPGYLPKLRSTHYVFGLSLTASENIFISMESYYKKNDSAPTLNESKASFNDPDLLASTGESYGGEMMTRYNSDFLQLSCAYTIAWVFKEVNGIRYSPRYDSRHNINLSATFILPNDWQFTTSWVYHSGFPFTQQGGYYNKLSLNNFFNDYRIYELLTPLTYFNSKNAARLPDYHRLDLILSKKFDFDFMKLDMDISAVNVYDRKNLYYFEQNTGKRVNMLPFLLTATVKVEI